MGKLSQGLIYGGNIAGYVTKLGSPITATVFGIGRLAEKVLEQRKGVKIGDSPYLRLAKTAAALTCGYFAMSEFHGRDISGNLDGWLSLFLSWQIGSEAYESYLANETNPISDLRIAGRGMRTAGREISDVVRDLRK